MLFSRDLKNTKKYVVTFDKTQNMLLFNPKTPGGGGNPHIGQKIACHFSQDDNMVTKFLTSSINIPTKAWIF